MLKIHAHHSHNGGLEALQAKGLWDEIRAVITAVDESKCPGKKRQYSSTALNTCLEKEFENRGWAGEVKREFWLTHRKELLREVMLLPAEEQEHRIRRAGEDPVLTCYKTDFEKKQVVVEVQLSGKEPVFYDMFVEFRYLISVLKEADVGVEIVPMKSFGVKISDPHPFYEYCLHALLTHEGESAVPPLVLVGVAP